MARTMGFLRRIPPGASVPARRAFQTGPSPSCRRNGWMPLLVRFLLFQGRKRPQGSPYGMQLQIQIILVLKHGVMHAGPHEDVDHALYKIHRQPQLAGELHGVIVVADVHAAKERLAVFPVARAGVYLIHKSVFRPVQLGGQAGHFAEETLDVLKAPRRFFHEIVLHLCHAVGGGLDHDVVLGAEVIDQRRVGDAAGFRQLFHAGVFKAVFAKCIEADLQKAEAPLLVSIGFDGDHLPQKSRTGQSVAGQKNSKSKGRVTPTETPWTQRAP